MRKLHRFSDDVDAHHIGRARFAERDAGGDDGQIAVLDDAGLPRGADGRFKQLVGALLFLDVNRHHAPGQIHLPQHLFVRRAADDGDERAELGDHPARHSRFADGDDRGGVQVIK